MDTFANKVYAFIQAYSGTGGSTGGDTGGSTDKPGGSTGGGTTEIPDDKNWQITWTIDYAQANPFQRLSQTHFQSKFTRLFHCDNVKFIGRDGTVAAIMGGLDYKIPTMDYTSLTTSQVANLTKQYGQLQLEVSEPNNAGVGYVDIRFIKPNNVSSSGATYETTLILENFCQANEDYTSDWSGAVFIPSSNLTIKCKAVYKVPEVDDTQNPSGNGHYELTWERAEDSWFVDPGEDNIYIPSGYQITVGAIKIDGLDMGITNNTYNISMSPDANTSGMDKDDPVQGNYCRIYFDEEANNNTQAKLIIEFDYPANRPATFEETIVFENLKRIQQAPAKEEAPDEEEKAEETIKLTGRYVAD